MTARSDRESGPVSRRDVLETGGAVTGLLAIGATGVGEGSASRFQAGAGHVDASPLPEHLEEGVYLGGYGAGPEREATGVHDGVQARALAVRAGGDGVALLKLDLPGLGNRQIDEIRRRVSAASDLDPQAVLVASSHAHSAPDFQGLWGGVPASYRTYLVDRATEAVLDAVESVDRARARVGAVDAPSDLTFNRRGWGVTDTTLTTIQFLSGSETVGSLINFAAHPVVLSNENTLVATDYVGPLERAVEDAHGGTALFVTGAIGDVNPTGPGGGDTSEAASNGTLADAESYGRRVASVAEDAFADSEPLSPGLSVRSTTTRLPIDNCVFRAGFETGLMRPYYHGESVTGTAEGLGERATGTVSERLADLVGRTGDETPEAGAVAIQTPVTRLRLGSGPTVEAVTVPGEALTQLGLEVRTAIGGEYQCLLGETGNTMGYLVPRDEWNSGRNGSYEETVSLGYHTAPLYRDAVSRLYPHLSETGYSPPNGEWRICPDEQVRAQQQF